ncbi:DUF952 domain-containing protein [Paracoccus sp. (in: a-proteobacteria)]|uniref:DUF952 domain-containing protein n=1 Tax=Paracoccus sp. TaxID=267 RepID=UPI00272CE0A5|nr:DUF952 domain-containing protein [Paracoccus sp. (in: a-proteobacteria)]
MLIHKILRAQEWRQFQAEGRTEGAPVDLSDGYIHFSTAAQLPGTLSRHFADEHDLVLVSCDAASLGDALKWEPSRGGDLFPHLYRALEMGDVVSWRPLARGPDGQHQTGVS